MTFDFTKGKTAKYLVTIHMPDGCNDKLYYHYLKDAECEVRTLTCSGYYEKGTRFSLYDMVNDVRKIYKKI